MFLTLSFTSEAKDDNRQEKKSTKIKLNPIKSNHAGLKRFVGASCGVFRSSVCLYTLQLLMSGGGKCQVIFYETDELVVSNNDEGQAPEVCDNHNTIIANCYSMTQRNLH